MPAEVTFALGELAPAVDRRLAEWEAEGVGRRIWDRDPTVWAETDLPELSDRLGWLTLPGEMAAQLEELKGFASTVAEGSMTHVVLAGMGGSSLAPEVFQATLGNAEGYPELIVLDSTHPDAVRSIDDRIDLATTLFVIASKSGTTLETMSFFQYFWARLEAAGLAQGDHFIALTDPGSQLVELAETRRFRRVFETPPEVGGRYSALTAFGLVPAALIGADVDQILASAAAVAADCSAATPAAENPGLVLGAIWGEAALAGRDKVTFVVSPSLTAFPNWLEQLIAESTGKDGTGIVPVAGEDLAPPEGYADDRLFVRYRLAGENDADSELAALAKAGHPVVTIELAQLEDLGGEIFRAEFATAAAGAVLGIHPFNQPDVQLAKELARQAMAGDLNGGAPIGAVSPANANELMTWLGSLPEGGYIGLQAYAPMTATTTELLQALRLHLRDATTAATTVGFGPRFLHSTGQLHKGGPSKAIFMQLVTEPAEDLPVPETDYAFGHLIAAQAEGDYRALQERGQQVLRVQLGHDSDLGLETLIDSVSSLV